MMTVDLVPIKQTLLQALEKAISRVVAEKRETATSLGLWLDFRFGRLEIALNDDDDETFRCPSLEYFTRQGWVCAVFDDLADLEERLYNVETDDENAPKLTFIEGNHQTSPSPPDDEISHLYHRCVGWITDWLGTQSSSPWMPFWVRIEEGNLGEGRSIRVDQGGRKLPAKLLSEKAPPPAGLKPPKTGVKIFHLLGNDRKYVSLYPKEHRPVFRRQDSIKPKADGKPLAVHMMPEGTRIGDLASFERALAVLQNGPHTRELMDYFAADFEQEQLASESHSWTALSPKDTIEVLDQARTEFDRHSGPNVPPRVRRCEFDAAELRRANRAVFQMPASPFRGPFFMESEEQPGFLQFCEDRGIRGVQLQLIWCEDLSEILPRFEEFMELLRFRLNRLIGNSSFENAVNVECLHGIQKRFWGIGVFRETFNQSGAAAAFQLVPEIHTSIRSFLPYISPHAYGSREILSPAAAREVDARFGGRELLEEVRGLFCLHLPNALQSLKEMEATNSGHLASYGPAI